jgi:Rps23 Pro-64 3,4-dihydroxylase Tpa1-like proline 4-hydroxylase
MAFTRTLTPEDRKERDDELAAKAQLSDIYRREAIGAFEDYRELIKGKNK